MMKIKMTLVMAILVLFATFTAGNVSAQTVAPAGPTGTSAVNGSETGQVIVSWNAVADAVYYRIGWVAKPDYEATVAARRDWLEAFHFLDAANTGQTQWTLTRLSPGVDYYFIVASNDNRNGVPQYGDWSNLLTLTPASSVDYADQYPNCDAVRAHHPGGVKQGSPVYRSALDRDGDGIACEATSAVLTGNYLPIQSIGTFTGIGDGADNVIRLEAGVYRVTTTRQNTDGNFFVDVVELSTGDDRSVGIYGRGKSGGSETLTIYNDGASYHLQAGNYVLEVDTDHDWEVSIELLMAH